MRPTRADKTCLFAQWKNPTSLVSNVLAVFLGLLATKNIVEQGAKRL
jgi:hypothetical protein